ncbi:MAG: type VI secretion system baseplate subunit TssE [Candidatus Thiodiazotropha sp. (ex Monitilora ramsayi)]|nr:type VI secretion system baseplate subunit TssE [Candidatus Thiodiazotropha sp. (ex Monitilora ramsayi)]
MSETLGYGLFEVFTQEWKDRTPIHVINDDRVIVRSVQDHLSRLLNARQGVLSHLPDYGLPDITEVYADLPYTVGDLRIALEDCIKKYEPRIAHVEVVSLPDDRAKGVVILEIRATLLNGRKTRYTTYLKSEGDAKVLQGSDHG